MSDTRKNRYNIENIHSKHASYVKKKAEIGTRERFDKDVMLLGKTWYRMGHTLEDAEKELQFNTSFIYGYEKAARMDKINDDLYKLGMEYFKNGTPMHTIPSNYIENEFFRRGYNESLRLSLSEKMKRSGR